jgi:hypothetical protein
VNLGDGRLPILLLGCVLLAGCSKSIELGVGAHAPSAPEQWTIEAPVLTLGDFRVAPVAGYAITAKVLSKRRYRWDALAPIAPWDFALGWGAMSDEAWLRPTSVTQGDRFMFWHLYDSPLNIANVNRMSANVHLIPKNDAILEVLQSTPIGAIISLSGQLVNVHFPDSRVIPSSLTRLDTGAGACEILLVAEATVLRPQPLVANVASNALARPVAEAAASTQNTLTHIR